MSLDILQNIFGALYGWCFRTPFRLQLHPWRHFKDCYGDAMEISACHLVFAMDKIKSLVSLFFSPTPETSQISGITIGQEYGRYGLLPDHPNIKVKIKWELATLRFSEIKAICISRLRNFCTLAKCSPHNATYHFGALFVFASGLASGLLPDCFRTPSRRPDLLPDCIQICFRIWGMSKN